MAKNRKPEAAQAANSFNFSLAGLIIFSLSLIGGAAFVTDRLVHTRHASPAESFALVDPKDQSSQIHAGPWGELMNRDIELERPAEYMTDEVATPPPEVWTFNGMKLADVQARFTQSGLSASQIAAAFSANTATETSTGVVFRPPDDFLFSLSPETRGKLYGTLAGQGINLYLDYPYIFPGKTLDSIYADARLEAADVALLKQLVYPNGTARQMADYQALLGKIPTPERRLAMARALSRQNAVLARLVVNQDTDIDKLAQYWGNIPNVRFTDIRPLLESLKSLPEGGTVSLVYMLPRFARDRLYTYPLPPSAGEPTMDCHWSTFNFCNDTPDNRFNDPTFAIQYIQQNYYQIAAPSIYGDILLLMNDKNEIKHSAVFLADDLVFTKNGNNYRQPWMIMHIPDLLATYPDSPPMRPVYMRRKVD